MNIKNIAVWRGAVRISHGSDYCLILNNSQRSTVTAVRYCSGPFCHVYLFI